MSCTWLVCLIRHTVLPLKPRFQVLHEDHLGMTAKLGQHLHDGVE